MTQDDTSLHDDFQLSDTLYITKAKLRGSKMKFLASAALLASSTAADAATAATATTACGTSYAVTANRGSGDVSFLTADGRTNFAQLLPTSQAAVPEPMYVSYSRRLIFVGDRANDSVVVFDPEDPTREPAIIGDVCAGIFHQWSNDDRLVVACDVDKASD